MSEALEPQQGAQQSAPPAAGPQASPQPPVEPEAPQAPEAVEVPVEPPAESEPAPAFNLASFNAEMAAYLVHFGFDFSREATLTGRILTLGEARQKR